MNNDATHCDILSGTAYFLHRYSIVIIIIFYNYFLFFLVCICYLVQLISCKENKKTDEKEKKTDEKEKDGWKRKRRIKKIRK